MLIVTLLLKITTLIKSQARHTNPGNMQYFSRQSLSNRIVTYIKLFFTRTSVNSLSCSKLVSEVINVEYLPIYCKFYY